MTGSFGFPPFPLHTEVGGHCVEYVGEWAYPSAPPHSVWILARRADQSSIAPARLVVKWCTSAEYEWLTTRADNCSGDCQMFLPQVRHDVEIRPDASWIARAAKRRQPLVMDCMGIDDQWVSARQARQSSMYASYLWGIARFLRLERHLASASHGRLLADLHEYPDLFINAANQVQVIVIDWEDVGEEVKPNSYSAVLEKVETWICSLPSSLSGSTLPKAKHVDSRDSFLMEAERIERILLEAAFNLPSKISLAAGDITRREVPQGLSDMLLTIPCQHLRDSLRILAELSKEARLPSVYREALANLDLRSSVISPRLVAHAASDPCGKKCTHPIPRQLGALVRMVSPAVGSSLQNHLQRFCEPDELSASGDRKVLHELIELKNHFQTLDDLIRSLEQTRTRAGDTQANTRKLFRALSDRSAIHQQSTLRSLLIRAHPPRKWRQLAKAIHSNDTISGGVYRMAEDQKRTREHLLQAVKAASENRAGGRGLGYITDQPAGIGDLLAQLGEEARLQVMNWLQPFASQDRALQLDEAALVAVLKDAIENPDLIEAGIIDPHDFHTLVLETLSRKLIAGQDTEECTIGAIFCLMPEERFIAMENPEKALRGLIRRAAAQEEFRQFIASLCTFIWNTVSTRRLSSGTSKNLAAAVSFATAVYLLEEDADAPALRNAILIAAQNSRNYLAKGEVDDEEARRLRNMLSPLFAATDIHLDAVHRSGMPASGHAVIGTEERRGREVDDEGFSTGPYGQAGARPADHIRTEVASLLRRDIERGSLNDQAKDILHRHLHSLLRELQGYGSGVKEWRDLFTNKGYGGIAREAMEPLEAIESLVRRIQFPSVASGGLGAMDVRSTSNSTPPRLATTLAIRSDAQGTCEPEAQGPPVVTDANANESDARFHSEGPVQDTEHGAASDSSDNDPVSLQFSAEGSPRSEEAELDAAVTKPAPSRLTHESQTPPRDSATVRYRTDFCAHTTADVWPSREDDLELIARRIAAIVHGELSVGAHVRAKLTTHIRCALLWFLWASTSVGRHTPRDAHAALVRTLHSQNVSLSDALVDAVVNANVECACQRAGDYAALCDTLLPLLQQVLIPNPSNDVIRTLDVVQGCG